MVIEAQASGAQDIQRTQHLHSPWGLKWRSSVWFVTAVVGCGIATDLLIYSIVIPVVPFQLERLGYTGVSKLTGWLLLAYSGGIVVSTFPVAAFSERYKSRQPPFLLGLVLLVDSQIMFMEAPTYWVMILARIIQGFSSTIVWVVGLALLCDTVPERHVGKQLGLAMSGLTFGLLLGAPVGGALYGSFGFRCPFIFGIIITLLDLLGRLLVIERSDALKYGWDPTVKLTAAENDPEGEKIEDPLDKSALPSSARPIEKPAAAEASNLRKSDVQEDQVQSALIPVLDKPGSASGDVVAPPSPTLQETTAAPKHPSQWKAIVLLAKSPRAMTAFFNCFIEGIALTAIEPGFPLHMQRVWGYNSTKVGLVSIAAVIPTIFSSPLAGWLSDHAGTEYVVLTCIFGSIPFYIIAVIPKSVVLFIFAYACISFFISGCIAPLMADLAAVGHVTDGVGFAHVYGAFNIAYGLGSAVGPIIGGLAYDHHGWSLVCYICVAALAVGAVASFCFGGAEPLWRRLQQRLVRKPPTASNA